MVGQKKKKIGRKNSVDALKNDFCEQKKKKMESLQNA